MLVQSHVLVHVLPCLHIRLTIANFGVVFPHADMLIIIIMMYMYMYNNKNNIIIAIMKIYRLNIDSCTNLCMCTCLLPGQPIRLVTRLPFFWLFPR